MLSVLLWLPLAFGVVALLVPAARAWVPALAGAVGTLVVAVVFWAGFGSQGEVPQYAESISWIPQLGISYSLAIDGLSIFLVLLTALAWVPSVAFAASRKAGEGRERLFYFMLMLGESATLGAFLASDLILFVLFFDLMIVPFYFLFGIWGRDRDGVGAGTATMRMIIYTLVGSLLMLVGAVALGFAAEDASGKELSFAIPDLIAGGIPDSTQYWIFWLFALAFFIKMPLFPFNGWMPDAYRAAPLPALALFSAVLSKVGAYGFLRVVLPVMPDAAELFQTAILIFAVASIIYGSVIAFTKMDLRLIIGFSSIAQLGFITLGIFALDDTGANGALFQMVNHGLVVVPAILIVGLIAERTGSERLGPMGGLAKNAPIFAVIFLIVTMATLALPGSPNFIGEFLILNGTFQASVAIAIVASSGVALAAYYALRMYQRTMHDPLPPGSDSREISLRDGLIVVPMVLVVIVLAFAPQIVLGDTGDAVAAVVEKVGAGG
jgi:NADH-quinone oxidoreductase subunit M